MNSVFTLTFLVLLVLKLIGTITVSWWVVFSPLILGALIIWAVLVIAAVGAVNS